MAPRTRPRREIWDIWRPCSLCGSERGVPRPGRHVSPCVGLDHDRALVSVTAYSDCDGWRIPSEPFGSSDADAEGENHYLISCYDPVVLYRLCTYREGSRDGHLFFLFERRPRARAPRPRRPCGTGI